MLKIGGKGYRNNKDQIHPTFYMAIEEHPKYTQKPLPSEVDSITPIGEIHHTQIGTR